MELHVGGEVWQTSAGTEEGELKLHCEGSYTSKVGRLYFILQAEKALLKR